MSAGFLIAIPMKDPWRSKTRLTSCLSGKERHDLALALFQRTLDTIGASRCERDVLVVTASAEIDASCAARGVRVLREEAHKGLNRACERAAAWAARHSYAKMAILPADLALLSSEDIHRLADLPLRAGEMALCEATDGGTNCLMFRPADDIDFLYGPGSFRAYRRAAMARGKVCHVIRDSDMRFDVDTSHDLEALRLLSLSRGNPG